jgi:hypothetical protein
VTPFHVVVIIAAIVGPVVCALHGSCHESLPQILDLSKLTIVGTLGHAGAQKLYPNKTGQGKDT